MDSVVKEVAIDIGGGRGEYFLRRAIKEPAKEFLILEPTQLKIDVKPRNLHIIQWLSNESSSIPLKPSSVDEANINFLYGVIKWDLNKDPDSEGVSFAEKYEKILEDLKTVLKPGGKLHIVDAKLHKDKILSMLDKLGYILEGEPEPLKDTRRTFWSIAHASPDSELQPDERVFPTLIKAYLSR